MPTLGLDIGGANLKAATSDGRAAACSFPLWKSPERLTDALRTLTEPFADCRRIAVTMTGELADCFATKAEGVSRILDSVAALAQDRPVGVWTTAGKFVTPPEARSRWKDVAAANWQALATWAGRFAPTGTALLIDLGSTTTDVIPLHNGVPCPVGRSDLERLLSGELIYTGVRRTPLCAVLESVELRGQTCRIAAELFATMLDAHLITGRMAPDEVDHDTADGRSATVERANDRLARMVCCDRTELTPQELQSLAGQFVRAQQQQVRDAVKRVTLRQKSPVSAWILSGSGAQLIREILTPDDPRGEISVVELTVRLSAEIAESACAYALATLAEQTFA